MFPFSAQDRAAAVGAFKPDPRRTISKTQALSVYERAAKSVRDSESLYGGPATNVLLKAANLGTCKSIFEYGCGAGQLAERILSHEQAAAAMPEYLAIDLSPNMVAEASSRLRKFGGQARVACTKNQVGFLGDPGLEGRMDAFISTYVFDLLSDEEIANALTLAWRLLKPNGKLCLSGLTYGKGPIGWIATGIWEGIHWAFPEIVGGCRCQLLLPYLGPGWALDTDVTVAGGFLSSQVLVARKQPDQALF
ncbi:hypothetical protein WJX74_001520 [Apatococcus lobatus]|uniref:Methyltransferase type 12 domain-containing protein n=1 Tax=Apatococcus lobatus TaxID=904363 RepID=A0AAW1QMP6_9CHLO